MSARVVRTATIATLGCRLNQAESYRLQNELAARGVALRPFGEAVDLSIVNTCTVTHVADQQARQLLRRAARFSPGGFVVAVGCYAQVSPGEVAAVEGVDLVVQSDKEGLVDHLVGNGLVLGGKSDDDFPEYLSDDRSLERAPPIGEGTQARVRQFVKVQDGCDDYCTYCIVPFARGHSASRPAAVVAAEVRGLIERGCREVVLTGVQIGAYGRDRYPLREAGIPVRGAPLAQLVHRLLAETEIRRIRISSIQPQDWPDDLLELFSDPRLCRHLHLPLQSGSDATLRRMSRRYRTADFRRLVERIRSAVPSLAITADVIVGFPGESDLDHRASLDFVAGMEFSDAHVFRYSPRHGTAASRMADQILAEVKRSRGEEMREVLGASGLKFRRQFLGTRARVLWEEELPADDGRRCWTGLTGNYLRVNCALPADLLGQETEVRLDRLDGEDFGSDGW